VRFDSFKVVLFAVCLSFSLYTEGKDKPKYLPQLIPAALKENANAVFWVDQSSFQIHSHSKGTHKVFRAVTIFNAKAKDLSSVVVTYDKLSKITSIKGAIYDANGQVVKRLKSSEIYDQSMAEGSLFSDNRLKHMNLSHGAYPYTVEYEYEVEYKYMFYIPPYIQYEDEKVSLMSSEYTLVYPRDLKPRFKATLISSEPVVSDLGNNIESVKWSFSSLLPMKREFMGPSFFEVVPNIVVAPTNFEYEGYRGSMATWDDFGKWVGTLNQGRDKLDDATRTKIINLTKDLPTDEAKIKALYEYMQNKTRYVSIQLGIGGYQPFEASVVDQNGYGDCKALSNYMVAMLKTIGIKSHYVLVKSGSVPVKLDVSFPRPQFDHAIVCVPLQQDTVWLECTSQTVPFGYMGFHTGNRKALALTEEGAKVVSTPRYTEKENLQIRTADVIVSEDGNATATVSTSYSGLQYENGNLDFILNDTYENQKKWVLNNTSIPSFELNKFSFVNRKDKIPTAILKLDLDLNRFATVSGKRLFLTPNIMNRSTFIPEKIENRKTDIVLNMAYTDLDTIRFSVSEKIYPEFLPEPVKVESRFGVYEASFIHGNGQVIYIRKFTRRNGTYPPDSYNELIEFYKAINRADNMKLVFLTKT
jgi:transglutaminase-like putative cysteine protease